MACCGYNDPEGLDRLLQSCYRYVDLFLYVDGPFRDYGDSKQQTIEEETKKILRKYPNVVYNHASGLLEHDKRQQYLDACEKYDIKTVIVVDTDEYFHPDSDWEAFAEEKARVCNDRDHLYNIKNYTEIGEGLLLPLDQPRIIRHPEMVHYLKHHYQLAINGTEEAITAKTGLYSIKLCHDPHLRTQERKDAHDQYKRWLKRYEAKCILKETDIEKENRLRCVVSGN